MKPINLRIAEELGVRAPQVTGTISLLDGGATVPFVVRYRKEAIGALGVAGLRYRRGTVSPLNLAAGPFSWRPLRFPGSAPRQ